MRKQSTVTVVDVSRRKTEVKPEKTDDDREDAYAYLGLVTPPNPRTIEKGNLRKISIVGSTGSPKPPAERATIVGKHAMKKHTDSEKTFPGSSLEQGSIDSSKSKLSKKVASTSVVEPPTGYAALRESTNRANALVESILKEDLRWAGVPDQNYHTYKEGDFKFKLDDSKIKVPILNM